MRTKASIGSKLVKFLIVLAVGVVIIILVILTGCRGNRDIVKPPIAVVEKPKLKKFDGYEYWKPAAYDLLKKDLNKIKRIAFYNSIEIKMDSAANIDDVSVDEEGTVHIVDSIARFPRVIPGCTKGTLIIKDSQSQNKTAPMNILHEVSTNEKYEINYVFSETDSTFVVNKNKEVVVFPNNKEAKLKIKTKEVRLLYKVLIEKGEKTL